MSDDLRHRFRVSKKSEQQPSTDSIFGIWAEQNRIQAEEEKMTLELAETKKKAKELSKTLRAHRYGEVKAESLKKLGQYKSKFTKSLPSKTKTTKKWVLNHKRSSAGVGVLAVILVIFVGFTTFKSSNTATLGDSTIDTAISKDLPVEKPVFSMLFPGGKSETDFDVKRTNPEGSAPSYTYLDTLAESDIKFQVTQQKIPDNFSLEKTASDFQATDIIQIDDNQIYHGLSDKTKVQSLILVKKERLVLISSPQKFTDDQWAGYILSLQ